MLAGLKPPFFKRKLIVFAAAVPLAFLLRLGSEATAWPPVVTYVLIFLGGLSVMLVGLPWMMGIDFRPMGQEQ